MKIVPVKNLKEVVEYLEGLQWLFLLLYPLLLLLK
jgi:hypothetical protein